MTRTHQEIRDDAIEARSRAYDTVGVQRYTLLAAAGVIEALADVVERLDAKE